jgi:ACS family glucarate transporter-like MFS transporter
MSFADASRPTRIRYALLAVATANAFLLYLDRICMTAVVDSKSFQNELGLSKADVGHVMSAFFFAYALGQLPTGWLAGRFGPRRMLVIYIVLWSFSTAFTGFTYGILSLVAVRLVCGLAEAGAYPSSARLIARWFPFGHRGRANSVVAFGGRTGGALALGLTAVAIGALGAWRPVLWIYGAIGLVLAVLTHVIFRDEPETHPWTNAAERQLIRLGNPAEQVPVRRFPWRELLRHRGLWLLSLGSIGMNFGWGFLITWMPRYLQEVRGLDEVSAHFDASVVLFVGMAGMLFGGWWCDALTGWFGPRWGRRLPFIIGGAVAVSAYLSCPLVGSPGMVVVACAAVAFAADSIVPAVWTMAQDMGGNHVAVTLGWSNMWGNFGVPVVAELIPFVLNRPGHHSDWREVFWLCAGGFVLLAACSWFVDCTQKLMKEDTDQG